MKEQQARNKVSTASASAATNGGRDSKKVTVSEFQKNVQSKAELIYILGVKGKSDINEEECKSESSLPAQQSSFRASQV